MFSTNENIQEDKIKKAVEQNSQVVINAYQRRKKENLIFPRVIFDSEILYQTALSEFCDKMIETLEKDIKWKTENKVESGKIIEKICKYEIDSKQILEQYADFLVEDFKQLSEKEIIAARTEIIKSSNKYILCFKSIFVNDEMLLITDEELNLIQDIKTKMQLINEEIIDENDTEYIIEVLNKEKLMEEDVNRAIEIYFGIDNTVGLENLVSRLLEFLKINNIVENKLFTHIAKQFIKDRNSIDEGNLVEYLNSLNIQELTEEYIEQIDSMRIGKKLSEDIILMLKQKELNNTVWINLILQNRASELDLANDIEEKLDLINGIADILDKKIIILRKEIIRRNLWKEYKSIFFEEHLIISKEEINLLNSVSEIKNLVDFSRIGEETILDVTNRINQIYLTKEDLIEIIGIFDKTTSNCLVDVSFIKIFFDIFKWKKSLIKDLTDEQRTYIYRILKDFLRLTDIDYEVEFSDKIGYIIKEIDNQLYIQAKSNINYYNGYIELVNRIDIPTDQTITNIINFENECKLNTNISDALWKKGYYVQSIVGRVLWKEELDIKDVKLNIEKYVDAYIKTIDAHDIMANNVEFLQEVLNKEKFYDIKTKEKLMPFYKLRQHIKFVEHIFETLSETDIYEYLKMSWELDTEEDSLNFQKLICDEKYIKLIENEEIYESVKFKLWKAYHKTLLTRARNKKFYS